MGCVLVGHVYCTPVMDNQPPVCGSGRELSLFMAAAPTDTLHPCHASPTPHPLAFSPSYAPPAPSPLLVPQTLDDPEWRLSNLQQMLQSTSGQAIFQPILASNISSSSVLRCDPSHSYCLIRWLIANFCNLIIWMHLGFAVIREWFIVGDLESTICVCVRACVCVCVCM